MFNNSGTVRVDPSQTNVTLGSAKTFVNNGVLDLRNPNTVATNLTIQGNYVAQDPQINLNVLATAANTGQQQANHLTITGAASGATNVSVTPFNRHSDNLPQFHSDHQRRTGQHSNVHCTSESDQPGLASRVRN